MENSKEVKEKQEEQIVSLNEDSKKHQHDSSSFEKLINDQKSFVNSEDK